MTFMGFLSTYIGSVRKIKKI